MVGAKQIGEKTASIAIAAVLLGATPQIAKAQTHPIRIAATDLAGALSQLARSENVELLFDQSLVEGKPAASLQGANSLEQALQLLLVDTGLSYRQTSVGTFVIFLDPTKADSSSRQSSLAIEEILVIGRRTQNTDIRRSEDDIQPYQISNAAAISEAQPSSVEDFFRNHLSSNTQAFASDRDPYGNRGSTRSQINLRGLGPEQTLVLIDGRRLASIPVSATLAQPDVNGLAPGMIDRIEVLGTPAGGIFGIGAAGGVVNIVLKHDLEGLQFEFGNGLSDRGDAWHWRLGGLFGFSISETGTHILLQAGHSEDRGLVFGDREFVTEARAIRAQRQPSLRESLASPSINFNSPTGEKLTLVPGLGGAALNASTTYLPIDAPPVAAGGAAILRANAGGYDISLSPDGQGVHQSLVTPMRTTSLLATIRQTLGSRLEAYLDLLWLQNDGRATIPAIETYHSMLAGGAPGNPFRQTVTISFPTPGLEGQARTSTVTNRISAGVIVRLGGDWSANFDVSVGQARISSAIDAVAPQPVINAIQGLAALNQQLSGLTISPYSRARISNELNDFNLRIGGSVFELPGGPLTLTATGEFFQEFNSGGSESFFPLATLTPTTGSHSRRQVGSVFFEARAPLISQNSRLTPLRGLELQLAMRGDRYTLVTPGNLSLGVINPAPITDAVNRQTILAETLGMRVTPTDGLTLRASMSTGFTPPTMLQITSLDFQLPNVFGYTDPQRGGPQPYDFSQQFLLSLGGSTSLRAQRTIAYSTGLIMRPADIPGLRFSIDYTRLKTTGEITNFAQGDVQYFVDHEADYPDRVTRAPLTTADAGLGYTAGRITAVNASYLQIGRSLVQAVDFNLEYLRPTSIGSFRFHGRSTWEMEYRRRGAPDRASYDLVDHADGPLSWRANGGIGWMRNDWSTALDFTVFGAQSGYSASPPAPVQLTFLTNGQPFNPIGTNSDYIPPQFYFDWILGLKSKLNLFEDDPISVEYRFGIKNLLDSKPPNIAGTLGIRSRNGGIINLYDYDPLGGYSPFGDPFGRRFELSVSIGL